MTMKNFLTLLSFAFILIFSACNTVPEIPTDLSYTQLIQKGQDSIEFANYKAAEAYYQAAIQRYGLNVNQYIEATYELGHLYVTQKKYDKAVTRFLELEALYQEAEAGTLPAAYKKLTQINLDKIPEKYKPAVEEE